MKERKGVRISLRGLDHFETLILMGDAGYTYLPKKGDFIRKFDKGYRFHIYIIDEKKLDLHCDVTVKGFDGLMYHQASLYKCKEESKRIKTYLPPIPPKPIKITQPKKQSKNVFMPREEYLKAMKELENKNPLIE